MDQHHTSRLIPSWEERHAPLCEKHNFRGYVCLMCAEEATRNLTIEALRMQLITYKYRRLEGTMNERERRMAESIFKELMVLLDAALAK